MSAKLGIVFGKNFFVKKKEKIVVFIAVDR